MAMKKYSSFSKSPELDKIQFNVITGTLVEREALYLSAKMQLMYSTTPDTTGLSKTSELLIRIYTLITVLILSGMDFINLKQYSLSKWFQFPRMHDAFSFKNNFHPNFQLDLDLNVS